ncbi:alpha/beta fold hydrolase [Mucilaginibacter sp. 21P]|uniref:alpha/beta fold hydrolase n=1 Tax=Mucilaginibacter sp. 21P TaxID=2778902 RepID=UPI001C59FD3A|nr:alpha/beta fold hydrolase [Mucilaginibacter sp. 21P]QXV63695.1 alpha/beta fold hydrolase [Mucilaginibacter sp. 21P]
MTTTDQSSLRSAKPALVFLHYFGGAAKSWQWLIDELSHDHDCLALDLPGFGGSEPLVDLSIETMAKNVIGQVKRQYPDRAFILVGHSMGGKIAMKVAHRLNLDENLQRLLLLAPSPPTIERMPDEEKKRMLIHPNEKQALVTVDKGTIQKLSGERLQTAVETQLAVDNGTWQWWLNEGMRESIADHAKNIHIPVDLIVSSDDPAIKTEMTEEETIPNLPKNSKVIWTSGIGHLMQLENPIWLAITIGKLLSPAIN